jgi:hypothetical protein
LSPATQLRVEDAFGHFGCHYLEGRSIRCSRRAIVRNADLNIERARAVSRLWSPTKDDIHRRVNRLFVHGFLPRPQCTLQFPNRLPLVV